MLQGRDASLVPENLVSSPAVRGAQALLMRFVLLFVVIQGWNLIERLISPVIGVGISSIIGSADLSAPASVAVGTLVTLVAGAGDFVIFALFAWPLLSDILKVLGLPLRDALRPRAVPSVRTVERRTREGSG